MKVKLLFVPAGGTSLDQPLNRHTFGELKSRAKALFERLAWQTGGRGATQNRRSRSSFRRGGVFQLTTFKRRGTFNKMTEPVFAAFIIPISRTAVEEPIFTSSQSLTQSNSPEEDRSLNSLNVTRFADEFQQNMVRSLNL
jgi:hypothetical protein